MEKSTVTIELDQVGLNAVLSSLDQQSKALAHIGLMITEKAKAQIDAANAALNGKANGNGGAHVSQPG